MTVKTLTLSPLRHARREKILETAELLFSKFGFRAVTMEEIAAQVCMSKVTVYGYFKDKQSIFEAVAMRVSDRLLAAVTTELADPGDLADRLSAALISKHMMVWELVRRSAFSSELFLAKSQLASTTFQMLDDQIIKELTRTLKQHDIVGPTTIARILFAAANGIANFASSPRQLKKDISVLVHQMVST